MISPLIYSVVIVLLTASFADAVASQTEYPRSRTVARAFQKTHPCPSTGLTTAACPGFIKDHIVALCDGGPDTVANLPWQTIAAARAKDRTECHHRPAAG